MFFFFFLDNSRPFQAIYQFGVLCEISLEENLLILEKVLSKVLWNSCFSFVHSFRVFYDVFQDTWSLARICSSSSMEFAGERSFNRSFEAGYEPRERVNTWLLTKPLCYGAWHSYCGCKPGYNVPRIRLGVACTGSSLRFLNSG